MDRIVAVLGADCLRRPGSSGPGGACCSALAIAADRMHRRQVDDAETQLASFGSVAATPRKPPHERGRARTTRRSGRARSTSTSSGSRRRVPLGRRLRGPSTVTESRLSSTAPSDSSPSSRSHRRRPCGGSPPASRDAIRPRRPRTPTGRDGRRERAAPAIVANAASGTSCQLARPAPAPALRPPACRIS
jgi:hypothetical protein